MLNVKQRSCEYQLKSFGLRLGQEIKAWSADYEANALTTEPRADIAAEQTYLKSPNKYVCYYF